MGAVQAAHYDLTIVRGAVYRRRFTFTVNGATATPDAAEAANAAGLDLAPTIDGDAVVLEWSATESLALSVGSWPWDMYVTIDGDRHRVVSGVMAVVSGVAEGLL